MILWRTKYSCLKDLFSELFGHSLDFKKVQLLKIKKKQYQALIDKNQNYNFFVGRIQRIN